MKGQRNKKLMDASGNKLNDKGETEWFFTDEKTIHEAFTAAHTEFGGRLETYTMLKYDNGKKGPA